MKQGTATFSKISTPMQTSSSKKNKSTKSGGYSSLPTADDESDPESNINGNDNDSDEEESIQLNNLPLSLSQIMNLSKTAVTNVMEVAVQGGNSLNEFIQTNTSSGSHQSGDKITRSGTFGPSPTSSSSSSSSSLSRGNQRNVVPEESFENSML